MKKIIIFSAMLICLIFLIGCGLEQKEAKTEEFSCKKPYIEFKTGECCLDQNNNQICDTDETQEITDVIVEEAEPKVEEVVDSVVGPVVEEEINPDVKLWNDLVDNVPEGYIFRIDKGAVVYPITALGLKRSIGEYLDYADNAYWNFNSNELLVYAGEIAEPWWCKEKDIPCEEKDSLGAGKYLPSFFKLELTGDRDKDRVLIPKDLNRWYWWGPWSSAGVGGIPDRTKWVDFYYDKSPVDWMMEYKDEVPIKISRTKLQLKSVLKQVTSDLAITFNHKTKTDRTLIFRFDPKEKVPIHVEEVENKIVLMRHVYDFTTDYYKDTFTKLEVTDELVDPPKDYIIISFDERKEYEDYLEGN